MTARVKKLKLVSKLNGCLVKMFSPNAELDAIKKKKELCHTIELNGTKVHFKIVLTFSDWRSITKPK